LRLLIRLLSTEQRQIVDVSELLLFDREIKGHLGGTAQPDIRAKAAKAPTALGNGLAGRRYAA